MTQRSYTENLMKLSEDYKSLILILKANPTPTTQNWRLDGFDNVATVFVSYHNQQKTEKLMVFKIWKVFDKKFNYFVTIMSLSCQFEIEKIFKNFLKVQLLKNDRPLDLL